jgi:putative transposase
MIRGFKYRFYPTPEQAEHLSKVFGHSRFVYNWMLAKRKVSRMTYGQASAQLTLLKKEYDWLNDVSCVPLQQSLRHQQRAFVNLAQKRAKFPTFKKKTDRQSAEFTKSAFTYRDGVLALSKLGALKIVWSQRFKGEPTTIHLSKTSSGRYYVSLRVDAPLRVQMIAAGKIGIDLGLTDFAVTSDNERFRAPKPLVSALQQLKRAQQTLFRRRKGSKNRSKARLGVAKIHQKVADIRTDWLHKLSTRLVQENQLIAVETLAVRNMIGHRSLARSISDAGWGEFVRQLDYKCKWYGRRLVKIDPFFPSSKLCASCGQVLEMLPLDVRVWTCHCGVNHDRDRNAANTILAEGIRLIACGETVRPKSNLRLVSAKQEPLASCA